MILIHFRMISHVLIKIYRAKHILKQECQAHNLVLCELGRRESQGLAISASRVRALLAEHGVDSKKLKSMVPETTLAFLEGAGADRVLAGLKKKDTD